MGSGDPAGQLDAKRHPPGRSTRASSANARCGGRWFSKNAATAASTAPVATGNATTSPFSPAGH